MGSKMSGQARRLFFPPERRAQQVQMTWIVQNYQAARYERLKRLYLPLLHLVWTPLKDITVLTLLLWFSLTTLIKQNTLFRDVSVKQLKTRDVSLIKLAEPEAELEAEWIIVQEG